MLGWLLSVVCLSFLVLPLLLLLLPLLLPLLGFGLGLLQSFLSLLLLDDLLKHSRLWTTFSVRIILPGRCSVHNKEVV